MTPVSAALLHARAVRQVDNGHCACHVTADQLAELAACYACLHGRMEKVERLARQALVALADHHLGEEHDPCVHKLLGEIVELSTCV